MQIDIYSVGKFFQLFHLPVVILRLNQGWEKKRKKRGSKLLLEMDFGVCNIALLVGGYSSFETFLFERYKRQNILVLHLKDFIFFVIRAYICFHRVQKLIFYQLLPISDY